VDLYDNSLVGLQDAMSGAALRQQVLANNIANANTPNFKRSDVDFQGVLAQAFANNPTPQSLSQISFQPDIQSTGGSMQVDGNNVDIDTEMSDLSENTLDSQAMSSVMTTRLMILRTAIGNS
jgi:flagellar basal-body rod protein FlgB